MAILRVYELQTYRDGAWKIDSVYDDRDLAMMEADRVNRANRFSAVRLVEETFDENTERGASRTIFRASRAERANTEADIQKSVRELRAAPPRAPEAKPKPGIIHQLVMACVVFGLITTGGLILLYYLNTLTTLR